MRRGGSLSLRRRPGRCPSCSALAAQSESLCSHRAIRVALLAPLSESLCSHRFPSRYARAIIRLALLSPLSESLCSPRNRSRFARAVIRVALLAPLLKSRRGTSATCRVLGTSAPSSARQGQDMNTRSTFSSACHLRRPSLARHCSRREPAGRAAGGLLAPRPARGLAVG